MTKQRMITAALLSVLVVAPGHISAGPPSESARPIGNARPSAAKKSAQAPPTQPAPKQEGRTWSDLPRLSAGSPPTGAVAEPAPARPPTAGSPSNANPAPPSGSESVAPEPLPAPAADATTAPRYFPPGSFVTDPVKLYPLVHVDDPHEVAPGAIPMVISVKDPNTCQRQYCAQCRGRCVYVRVWIPPCPLRKFKVEDHGAEIELDYGHYEVEIDSEDGVVKVEYDD